MIKKEKEVESGIAEAEGQREAIVRSSWGQIRCKTSNSRASLV